MEQNKKQACSILKVNFRPLKVILRSFGGQSAIFIEVNVSNAKLLNQEKLGLQLY